MEANINQINQNYKEPYCVSSIIENQQKAIIDKYENDQENEMNLVTSSITFRKLSGKCVYLDLSNSYKHKAALKSYLEEFNVRIGSCLSKEINHVITDRLETNIDQTNNQNSDCKVKSDSKIKKSSNGLFGRTQAILQKASKNLIPPSNIISTANRFGINIINVSELDSCLRSSQSRKNVSIKSSNQNLNSSKPEKLSGQKLKIKNLKVHKLADPYLKLESYCKQYRPVYKEFTEWHEIVIQSDNLKNPICPAFQTKFTSGSYNGNSNDKSNSIESVIKSGLSKTDKNISNNMDNHLSNEIKNFANEKFIGYCESCNSKYENLAKHLESGQHDNFAKNSKNFQEIDGLINERLNFLSFLDRNNLNALDDNSIMESQKKSINNHNHIKSEIPIMNMNVENHLVTKRIEIHDLNKSNNVSIHKTKSIHEDRLSIASKSKSSDDGNSINLNSSMDFCKKRKRLVFSFSIEELKTLNESYSLNSRPSNFQLALLSTKLNYDMELINEWFLEKSQESESKKKEINHIKTEKHSETNNIKRNSLKKIKDYAAIDLLAEYSNNSLYSDHMEIDDFL